MRAVNLLPEKHRPRQRSGGGQGNGSYILLGVLGLVVAGVLVYVLTINSINSAQTDIASAEAATAQAQAQASQLGAYGSFAQVKTERVAAVKNLAQSRMDWERLVRELATVLPDGVWIQNASAADGSPAAGTTPTASSSATAGSTADASGPTLTLQGCARDQAQVADSLVRLREMQGASDVKLDHSTKPSDVAAGTDSASSAGDCGATAGQPNYEFQIAVTFQQSTSGDSGNVPTRLGGGQ
jgi:Tfp pilus assembly protein PilN